MSFGFPPPLRFIPNPFDVGVDEIRNLTPRRKDYIQRRNAAQDERITDISDSILHYQTLLKEVRERYKATEPEDQYLIKPYLTILYFELGQLFEAQKHPQDALRYYEQAGIYGHPTAMENAKRLGSTLSFVSANPCKEKPTTLEAFYSSMVLIESDTRKGSGVLALDSTLGNTLVLMTVEHVALPAAVAYIRGEKISLDDLKMYSGGSDTLCYSLGRYENASPTILAHVELHIGEKVYFGGYPFKKTEAYLHTGHVSSIGRNGKFSIDGVAVPGMSGGPIAVERDSTLYVVGTIASETFDPIEGFAKALDAMYLAEDDTQTRNEWAESLQASILDDMQRDPQLTKIPKGTLFIANLDYLTTDDPDFFTKIWEDLNEAGIISDEGGVESEKIISGQLGLRSEFKQYEDEIIGRLNAKAKIKSMDPSEIALPFDWQQPTDPINTVGLSLVQSLSTGVITGNLFQGFSETSVLSSDEESSEFAIGRTNRRAKIAKKQKQTGRSERDEAIQLGTFINHGAPPVLYRFVSTEAAKDIKKNGIVHLGGEEDEIPFVTRPNVAMALSVGAVATDRLVTVYTDRIPGLSADNVRRVSERKGTTTFRINVAIPPAAIEISEG